MAQVLRHLTPPAHADLLVGTDTADDAAVWSRPDGRALVATADFFTPIVDDPRTWGRIAGANAVSDVYAMGATPLFALNLAAWPKDVLSLDMLGEVLAGGADIAAEGGWIVAGGHTVDGREPMYGQAVIGEVDAGRVLTNAGGRPGEALVLTKPLGTGIVATMVKRATPDDIAEGGAHGKSYAAAVREMTRLNDVAARALLNASASAATDVTGFGLLGHLHEMTRGGGLAAEVDVAATPVLDGAWDLLDAGFVPGGTATNLESLRPHVIAADGVTDRDLTLLADAQTSGGLLAAVPAEAADDLVADLRGCGHDAAVIGALREGDTGVLHVH